MVTLIRDFDTTLIKFKKSRKTSSGSIIIDLEEMPLLQSPWCKIVYPVEHSINLEASSTFLKKCQEIDNMIVDHCAKVFDFCPQEITEMYKSIIKYYGLDSDDIKYVFRISMNTTTVIFESKEEESKEEESKEGESKEYTKSNAGEILKVGDYVRVLFKIKKITMSNHEIKLQMDLSQVEKFDPRLLLSR